MSFDRVRVVSGCIGVPTLKELANTVYQQPSFGAYPFERSRQGGSYRGII
jgi:hypothetical protein